MSSTVLCPMSEALIFVGSRRAVSCLLDTVYKMESSGESGVGQGLVSAPPHKPIPCSLRLSETESLYMPMRPNHRAMSLSELLVLSGP